MGILKRKWLIDHYDIIVKELEYHRDHNDMFSKLRRPLWRVGDKEGRIKVETPRR